MSLTPLACQRSRTRQVFRNSTSSFLFVTLCIVSGCASGLHGSRHAVPPLDALHRQCERLPILQRTLSDPGVPELPGQSLRGHTAHGAALELSPPTQHIAAIIGASDLLVDIGTLEASREYATDRGRIRSLELRQQLYDRLLLTSFEIDSVTAEGACEQARADRFMDRLEEIRDDRVRTLTIIAVVGDAIAGVLAGGLSLAAEATASAIASIGGGSIATGFGLAAFLSTEPHELRHERNLLREVWEGPEQPRLFQNSVWRYLTTASDDAPTLRESLIAQWREDGNLGTPGSETERHRIALFFGEGGLYSIDELRARADMFDSLRAVVNLMNQDLNLLFREVRRYTARDSRGREACPDCAQYHHTPHGKSDRPRPHPITRFEIVVMYNSCSGAFFSRVSFLT